MSNATEVLERYDVAICGAGPVGLLLAAELAAHGIRVVVLERTEEPSEVAKANGIVGRAAVEMSKRGYLAGKRSGGRSNWRHRRQRLTKFHDYVPLWLRTRMGTLS